MSGPGLLSQLARRAVAGPEVRPRLASRYETLPAAAEPHRGPAVGPEAAPPLAAPASREPVAVAAERPEPAVTRVALPGTVDDVRPAQPGPMPSPVAPPAPAIRVHERLTVQAPPPPVPARSTGDPAPTTTAAPPAAAVAAPPAVIVQRRERAEPPPPRLHAEALQPLFAPPPPRHDVPAGVAAGAVHRPAPTDLRRPQAAAAPSAPARLAPAPAAPPPIEITIGRIDVRAVAEPAPRAAAGAPAAPRTLGLADYLRRRSP